MPIICHSFFLFINADSDLVQFVGTKILIYPFNWVKESLAGLIESVKFKFKKLRNVIVHLEHLKNKVYKYVNK